MKLSICIPTINRAPLLKETIDSILPQLGKGVRLFISNNASTDDTEIYLKDLKEKFPHVEIINWSTRVDVDQSMERTASLTDEEEKNEYIFLLGDDDVLLPGAIQNIVNELKTEPDVLILNGIHMDKNLAVKKHEHLPEPLKEKVFENVEEAFFDLWDTMPFGSFVAKKECFKNFDIFYGTSHAYAGTVWYQLARKLKVNIKCSSQPTVLIRSGEKTWAPEKASIMVYAIPRWFSLLGKLPKLKKVSSLCKTAYVKRDVKPEMISELRKTNLKMLSVFRELPWKFRWKFLKYWRF